MVPAPSFAEGLPVLRCYEFVRQNDQSDCGAAALAMIALNHRIPVRLQRMTPFRVLAQVIPAHGTRPSRREPDDDARTGAGELSVFKRCLTTLFRSRRRPTRRNRPAVRSLGLESLDHRVMPAVTAS